MIQLKLRDAINAIGAGCIWAFCYLVIRRGLNPRYRSRMAEYGKDAIFGGMAAATAYLISIPVLRREMLASKVLALLKTHEEPTLWDSAAPSAVEPHVDA